jgi:hypothetical protein
MIFIDGGSEGTVSGLRFDGSSPFADRNRLYDGGGP